MILKIILNTLLFILLTSCSSNFPQKSNNVNDTDQLSPENQYIEAMKKFESQEFDEAVVIFQNIEKIYPLSNEAAQSKIMSGFIEYLRLDYDLAIMKFTKIIKKYPSLKNLDYVYYIRALCYYEQISDEGLDGKYNTLALENLNQVINRIPNTKYAKDSSQKIILVKSNIEAKHMDIGRFYQKNKKYTAALNRYKIVVDSYSETKFTPEALYRISEIYYSIGMLDESVKTAAILGHNYPNSEWYEFSFYNLNKKDEDSIFSRSIDKIFNK